MAVGRAAGRVFETPGVGDSDRLLLQCHIVSVCTQLNTDL